jgi:hypothetical protein
MTISLYPNTLIYFVQEVGSPGIGWSCNPNFKNSARGRGRLGFGIKSRVSILVKFWVHHGIT